MKHLSILHTFALGVALVPCLSSCISDDSQEGNKPLSLISAAQTVEDVYNVDNRLNVQYSYRGGLYAVAASGDSTQLSYIPLDGRQPESDVFAKNNPGQHLEGNPQALTVTKSLGKQDVFVSVGSPSRIYKLDGNTMSVGAVGKLPFESTL